MKLILKTQALNQLPVILKQRIKSQASQVAHRVIQLKRRAAPNETILNYE